MQKIIISTSDLKKTNWELIFRLISSIINKDNKVVIEELKKEAKVTITSKYLEKDPYSTYGDELTFSNLPYSDEAIFSIIYEKKDDEEDFANIVPFFILKQKFSNRITLGIDVSKIPIEQNKQRDYIFKCSEFFRFINDEKPLLGTKSIYIINEKTIDKSTGEIKNVSSKNVTSLRGKSIQNDQNNYNPRASRRYLPLLKITKENYKELFQEKTETEYKSNEAIYIIDSITKISEKLNNKTNQYPTNQEYSCLFEKWFIKTYFYFLNKYYKEIEENTYKSIEIILHTYCNNIYELIQNIIFHTSDKRGLMYLAFDSKENLSKDQTEKIPDYNIYETSNQYFLEMAIIDFNEKGIIENFNEKHKSKNSFRLIDFFDINIFRTTALDHIDLRHTAHLGLKTFVKSIISHKGYFRVESNFNGKKETVSLENGVIKPFPSKEYIDGTHYEIILPIIPIENTSEIITHSQIQKGSLLRKLQSRVKNKIPAIKSICIPDNVKQWESVLTKEEQIKLIETIGIDILKSCREENEIAIDLKDTTLNINLIFKLLAYLQLSKDLFFEKIILTHLSDAFIEEFCNTVKTLLIDSGITPIWSNKSAIILMSETLRYQIICGETTDDLYSLNNEFQKYYYPRENFFKESGGKELNEELNKFLLPYEILIDLKMNPCFHSYVLDILKNPIELDSIGYLVKHENTYIGSKLIVKNYYEADSMFQNSFFTDRFAFIIAQEIQKKIDDSVKQLVIIGYQYYSELLVKTIKKLLPIKTIIGIAHQEKDGDGITFDFDTDNIRELIKWKFITIVPIGSSLSTNDKIIAFLKQQIGNEIEIIHNHSAIVVRDQTLGKLTDFEKVRKWISIDIEKKVVTTNFKNAQEIQFDIQVGSIDKCKLNWYPRLNIDISYPSNYWDEKYVNFTENASINSQNLMGLPKLNSQIISSGTRYNHTVELERLYELKNNIYSGHIDCHKSHYSYYIDTESYLKRSDKPMFDNWVTKEISIKKDLKKDVIDIIITPNAKIESEFVNIVNEKVFFGNALVVYLDVNNWKNNIIQKLSYIKELYDKSASAINFHYVDHVFLTAETYLKTKSYLLSILTHTGECHYNNDRKNIFSSAIALINRLSFDKDLEVKEDINNNLFIFLNLFIPASKDSEKDCILCTLGDYYKKLEKNTVLESCNNVISDNLKKIELISFGATKGDSKKENEFNKINKPINDRKFLRMFFVHEIYYKLSCVDHSDSEAILKNDLDKLYNEIFKPDLLQTDPALNVLNKWYNDNSFNFDKRISFLKAISTPPISQYIMLRKYGHEKLLIVLSELFNKNTYEYDDIRLLKSLLKSLSFLKSNALVRKEVIINSWNICTNVLPFDKLKEEFFILNNNRKELNEKLEKNETTEGNISELNFEKSDVQEMLRNVELQIEKKRADLAKISEFKEEFQFYIKNAIFEDETKSMYLGELLRTGEEIVLPVKDDLKISCTIPNNSLFTHFGNNNHYKEFLVWLFYDNTTIIRKTLNNFEKELKKDDEFNKFFYKENNQLKDLENAKNSITEYKNKVKEEYYYSNFKPYLDNTDGIDFVEKLVCVLYAKKKLAELNEAKGKHSIEKDIDDLLKIFASIMGADDAFLTIKQNEIDEQIYIIGCNDKDNKINGHLSQESYTYRVLTDGGNKHFKYPIISKDLLETDSFENKKLKSKQCCLLLISRSQEQKETRERLTIGAISFLYKRNLPKDEFRIKCRESGRLLLLLKEELNKYILDYLVNEKVFDLWVEKKENQLKFEKIYNSSSHVFNSVFNELEEFEKLNEEYLQIMSRTWFWLTNETISYLYANIENNYHTKNLMSHYLNIEYNIVNNSKHTTADVFNNTFITILKSLLKSRWDGNKHRITINGIDIADKAKSISLNTTKIHCNKYLLQTFVVQCIHNSLDPMSRHGHCSNYEEKEVRISVNDLSIKIEDIILKESYNKEEKIKRKNDFKHKVENIQKMRCKSYSSTTLTSLQGFVNYMQENGSSYDCDFSFNEYTYDFILEIFFNKPK